MVSVWPLLNAVQEEAVSVNRIKSHSRASRTKHSYTFVTPIGVGYEFNKSRITSCFLLVAGVPGFLLVC